MSERCGPAMATRPIDAELALRLYAIHRDEERTCARLIERGCDAETAQRLVAEALELYRRNGDPARLARRRFAVDLAIVIAAGCIPLLLGLWLGQPIELYAFAVAIALLFGFSLRRRWRG